MSIGRGLTAGLIGGLAAAGAMSAGHALLSAIAPAPPPQAQQEEDATVKMASAVARVAVGRDIPDDDKPLAGSVVHYAFGATVGAAYGALSEVIPGATRGVGLPFGAAVWLGAHVVTVPALGLAPPPWRRPLSAEATEFLLHLLYGATTESVRRLLRRVF